MHSVDADIKSWIGDSPGSTYVNPDEVQWEPSGHEGVRMKVLFKNDAGLFTGLFEFEPGATLPPHEHVEVEQSYVISGSLHDHDGVALPGHFVWRPSGNRHTVVSPNGALVLGVFMKPNKFKDEKFRDGYGTD